MSCVFGPVPSRRLGRSLGVDVVPLKTCTYDCIYCQLGRTRHLTVQREEWFKWACVLDEVKRKLDTSPDYITFSGSGEPTLYTRIGELIERIKAITSVPVAVLTNGSLLWRSDVRRGLLQADLVVPSLDAGDPWRFRHINRPHASLSFEQLVSGLATFRQEYRGQYWLEVFLLAGYTGIDAEVRKLAACIDVIRPDRVQFNTVTRPPAESFAEPVPREHLMRLAGLVTPPAEVISEYARPCVSCESESECVMAEILEILRRRPCSAQDVAAAMGLRIPEALKYIDQLVSRNLVRAGKGGRGVHYCATGSGPAAGT